MSEGDTQQAATSGDGESGPPAPRRTLRLALALRGGVSLAVWIGGAVAELDLFRRASLRDADGEHLPYEVFDEVERPRVKQYRELLTANDFAQVEIDILAGASAGGLNAVVLGLAQSRGVVLDRAAHSTWIRDGGLWNLLRTPGWGAVRSILDGDGDTRDRGEPGQRDGGHRGFFPLAVNALEAILDGRSAPAKPEFAVTGVSVDLAATVVSYGYGNLRAPVAGPDPAAAHEYRAGFTFATRPGGLGTPFSTIPQFADGPRLDPDGDVDQRFAARTDCLALAIRSTSSFPGAFEPAAIYSVTDVDTGKSGVERNASGCFPLAERLDPPGNRGPAELPTPFMVIDGGVFDNIPIDRALRAIQRTPAAGPTERRLLYLDPSPPAEILEPRAQAASSAWLSVLFRAGKLKVRQESSDDELDLVRRHNDEILKQRSRAEAFAASIRAGGAIGVPTDADYTEARIGPDVERIVTFLRAPWDELCVPPRVSIPLEPITPRDSLSVMKVVRARYGSGAGKIAVAGDLQAAIDCVYHLVLWVRQIESDAAQIPSAVGPLKAVLYRILTVLVEARRIAVCTPLVADRPSAENVDERLRLALDDSVGQQGRLRIAPELMTFLTFAEPPANNAGDAIVAAAGEPDSPDPGPPREPDADPAFYVALSSGLAVGPAGTGPLLLESIWLQLDNAVRTLRSRRLGFRPSPRRRRYWAESVWCCLAKDGSLIPASEPAGSPAQRLVKVMASVGLAGTASMVAFHTISGAQPPPEKLAEVVRGMHRNRWLTTWLSTAPRRTEDRPSWASSIRLSIERSGEAVAPSSKLAGARLGNFAGFLDWRWRANDWRWGRLDTASGIVDMVTSAGRDLGPTDTDADRLRALHDAILGQPEAYSIGDPPDLRVPTQPYRGFSSADISGGYRYALAARIGPLIGRACWPDSTSRRTVSGQVRRVGALLIRVLILPLILLAQPVRAAAVVATIISAVAAGWILQHDGEAPEPPVALPAVFGALLIVAAVLGFGSAWKCGQRWRLMSEVLEPQDAAPYLPWKADLDQARNSTSRWRIAHWVVALTVLAAGIALVVLGSRNMLRLGAPAYVMLVLIAAAALLTVGTRGGRVPRPAVPEPNPPEPRPRAMGINIAALSSSVVAVVLCVAPWWPGLTAQRWPSLLVCVAAGLVSACLCLLSLGGWARIGASLLVVSAASLATGLAAWGVDSAGAPAPLSVALLPVLVWLVGLGTAIGTMPVRERGYGEVPLDEDGAPSWSPAARAEPLPAAIGTPGLPPA